MVGRWRCWKTVQGEAVMGVGSCIPPSSCLPVATATQEQEHRFDRILPEGERQVVLLGEVGGI